MGYARKSLVSLQDTPYYHVISRCVRRAWLWGRDEYAGQDYSHRKQWVVDRARRLGEIFSIEVCAYAVMSNHYHLVLFVDVERAGTWSVDEVMERWGRLFRLPDLVKRSREPDALEAERIAAQEIIEGWRKRLMDVSWFMRCLNEHLARLANAEDGCTGRFWEGRFKSQALLDEAALLTAMAYVDLNPIRAGIARTPEESEFTSIYERIKEFQAAKAEEQATRVEPPIPLRRFADEVGQRNGIPFTRVDYFKLVDATGRVIRADKRGSIDAGLSPVLSRLNIDPDVWQQAMQRKGVVFGRAMGRLDFMRLHAATLGQSWIRGLESAKQLFA